MKNRNSIILDLKTILWFTILPTYFLFSFFFYFGLISCVIYDTFNLNYIAKLFLYLPHIFQPSFLLFGIMALFFGCLKDLRKIFQPIFYAFLFIYIIIYAVQYFSLYYTNRYLIPEAFFHTDQTFLLASQNIIIKLISVVLLFFISGYILLFVIRRYNAILNQIGNIRAIFVQAITTSLLFILFYLLPVNSDEINNIMNNYDIPTNSPEIALAKTIKQFCIGSPDLKKITLSDDLKTFLSSQFGLFYQPKNEYPQVKDWIYQEPVPFEKIAHTPKQPNIIIFFIESLSSKLLGAYGSKISTPNMDDFANQSMVVEGYFNHTFPTINGLRGQICSFYPVLGELEHSNQELVNIKLLGLPHILNNNGYKTAFFMYSPSLYSPSSNYVLNIKRLMQDCGFSEIFMAEDIQRRLLGLKETEEIVFKKSVSDYGMMVNLVNYIKECYDNKPFFLAVSTIGTHPSFEDYEGKMIDDVRKLDDAFGKFWDYFKKSKYYNNTLIILTADHAMPPNVQYKKFIGYGNRKKFFFEEIACIIFDKRYHFPRRFITKASSVDLVPSVLQLLEINNISNPFQGVSIFSDRKKYPSLLCTMMNRYYVYDQSGIRENLYDYDENVFEKYSHKPTDIFSDIAKQKLGTDIWFEYNRFLNQNNKIWNKILESDWQTK